MIETLNRTAAVTSAHTQSSTATTTDSAGNFAQILETATASSTASSPSATVVSAAAGKSDFVSGRIGIDLNENGVPQSVHYFDEQGELLTSSSFSAVQILKHTNEFGISLTDLQGLGEQMDAAGVGYRPYELYPDTGSNHGIDFDNLIAGGLGTAYDWREDPLVGQKGASGQRRLEAARALAEELGISSTLATPRAGVVPETASTASTGSNTSSTAITGTAAVAAAASVAAATATDTGLAQSAETSADTAGAVEDILVTSGSADSSDTGAALADAISDVISDVATAIFGDTASAATASSGATESSGTDTASVLSEQQENELLQLANNLSRQQPALAQHLLAVLQASLESKVA